LRFGRGGVETFLAGAQRDEEQASAVEQGKGPTMLQFRLILVPVDFSPASEDALHVARALARDHQARLLLMTVPTPPPPAREVFVPEVELAELVAEVRGKLTTLAAAVNDLPVELRVIAGEPGPAIVQAAQEAQADLIVMGTHGRSGLARLLMGSVAEYVLRHAPCPVLTIKPGHSAALKEEPSSLAKV
jgi:nucleotide-binding universal stress UspA family protein